MTMYAIIGRPGSGKSYEAVRYHIYLALKSGRKVVTNIPLNIEWFVTKIGEEVRELIELKEMSFAYDKNTVRSFSKAEEFTNDTWKNEKGQGALFVVDEAHLVYPTSGRGKQQSNDLLDCLEYFSGHRHYGHDIVLITQHLRKINNHARDMIEIQYLLKKHTALGSDKSYTQFTYDGATGRPNEIDNCIRMYNDEYYGAYKSYTQSEGEVQEAKAADIKPIYKRWGLYVPFIVLIACIYYASSSYNKLTGQTEQQEVTEQVKSSSPSVPREIRGKSKTIKGIHIFGDNNINDLFLLNNITDIYISNTSVRIIDGIEFRYAGFEVVTSNTIKYVGSDLLELNGAKVTISESAYNGAFIAIVIDASGNKYVINEKPYQLYAESKQKTEEKSKSKSDSLFG